MGVSRQGYLSSLFAAVLIGLCVAALLPNMWWAKEDTEDIKLSLWRKCVASNCTYIKEEWNKKVIHNEGTAERDGAVAGAILALLFAFAGILVSCCQKRAPTVVLHIFAVVFVCMSVGCWYRYQKHSLDGSRSEGMSKFKYDIGFGLIASAVPMGIFAIIAAAFIRKDEGYDYLA